MIRRLLATTGCAAAAVALVGLPSMAQTPTTTAGVSLAAHSQVLDFGPTPHPAPPHPTPPHPAPVRPASRTCAANFTQGSIGGVSKCLSAGQQCQQAHAADYTRYGFRCGSVGNRYQLTKTGATRPGPSHPVARAKPTPAPVHH